MTSDIASDMIRPPGARVSADMVGSATPLNPVRWSERDAMLYALGVGAGLGDPERELHFTTENTGGVTLKAIPSYVTILAMSSQPPALAALDIGRFLHAEHAIEILRPLPPSGEGFVRNRVVAVEDKGSGAIVRSSATIYADESETIALARSSSAIFVRGGGGFGGPRPPSEAFALPGREADFTVVHQTRPEQALLYRLSGDRHRLHSDPEFARERDFPRPILHGLCTYGFACRALLASFADGQPERLASMQARFIRPVLPGESLTTQMWRDGGCRVLFRTFNAEGLPVLDRGIAGFRNSQNAEFA